MECIVIFLRFKKLKVRYSSNCNSLTLVVGSSTMLCKSNKLLTQNFKLAPLYFLLYMLSCSPNNPMNSLIVLTGLRSFIIFVTSSAWDKNLPIVANCGILKMMFYMEVTSPRNWYPERFVNIWFGFIHATVLIMDIDGMIEVYTRGNPTDWII